MSFCNGASLEDAIQDAIEKDGPQSFKCPLLMSNMHDPVFTSDGHCYERAAILTWFSTHDTSPLSGKKLGNKLLVPAIALQNSIEEWEEKIIKKIPFSRLLVQEEINRGTAKVVYKAIFDNQRVAVVENRNSNLNAEFAKKIIAWITVPRHRRLLHLFGVTVDTHHELLVAELAPLGTVAEALQTLGSMPTRHKLVILEQVCEGLEALVCAGLILHQDLSLRNVFMFHYDLEDAAATSVKLSGIGLSHAEGEANPRWAAPEVLEGREPTDKSDMWSFGVLAWELLHADGRLPFATLADSHVAEHVLAGGRLGRHPACPAAVWAAVASCWAGPPDSRPDARRLRDALRAACDDFEAEREQDAGWSRQPTTGPEGRPADSAGDAWAMLAWMARVGFSAWVGFLVIKGLHDSDAAHHPSP